MSLAEDRVQKILESQAHVPGRIDELRKLARIGLSVTELRKAVVALRELNRKLEPVRVVVLSTYTLELMRDAWQFEALLHGFELDLVFGDFGQVEQALIAGELFRRPTDAVYILLRDEDVRRDPWTAESLADGTAVPLQLARMARGQGAGQLVVSILAHDSASPLEEALLSSLCEHVDFRGVRLERGDLLERTTDAIFDARMWSASSYPFTPLGGQFHARSLFESVWRHRRPPVKCVVLDCDETLWGGIVGECGLDGLSFCKARLALHDYLLTCRARGILLAICSKNDLAAVQAVFEQHPETRLRWEHFTASRVNWNDKAQNLVELADELNLGLESVLFVDDSPFECERVRTALPQVRVTRMPSEAEGLAGALNHLRELEPWAVTSEDLRRAESMREEQGREVARSEFGNLEDYLDSLGMELVIHLDRGEQVARVVQLCQRTNQFNLTTRRHDEAAIRRFIHDADSLVATCTVHDRFGNLGLVGVLILTGLTKGAALEVESCLFSCRALGRRAEQVFVWSVLSDCTRKSPKPIVGEFLPTAKNSRAATFWPELGFEESSPGRFELQPEEFSREHEAVVHFRIRRESS